MTAKPIAVAAPASTRRVWSIRWIVTGVAVLLTTAAVVSVGAVADRNARAALEREVQSRSLLLARNLALTSSTALLGEFPELTLQPMVRRLLDQQPEIAFAAVVDHHGRIQGHPDARALGRVHVPEAGREALRTKGVALGAGESLHRGRRDLLAEVPVHGQGGREVIGRAFVSLHRDYVERSLAESRRQQLAVMLAFLAVGVAAAFVLMSGLLRPIVALREGLRRIGRGDLDSPIELRDRTELGLLAETVNEMTRTLRTAQSEMLERERLGREMELARDIQQSLLPSAPMEAGAFVIRGDQRAAAEVGGDYFDIMKRPDGRIAIAVGDVAGKGLAGCLVMAMLASLLRALRDQFDSPAELLATLDARLRESLRPGAFVTLFYGILDPATGRLVYASAGHNPLLIARADGSAAEVLPSSGIPLAAFRGGAIRRSLQDHEVRLGPGDVALQYTDGYTEAFAASDHEEFGLSRVARVLGAHRGGGAAAVLDRLRAAIQEWTAGHPPSDDETLLVISAERPVALRPVHAPVGSPAEALALLEAAESGGAGLALEPELAALHTIQPWIASIAALSALPREERDWLVSALYEACGNIAEHGFAGRAPRPFHVWWHSCTDAPRVPGATAAEEASRALRAGRFVIRDDGAPYRPEAWRASDYDQRDVRLRGRGVGLDIIHHVMREAAYHPGTARGNVTVFSFGPRREHDNWREAA